MTPLSDLACRALAAFIHDLRPDFDAPGIVAELRRQRDRYDPWQLAAAMLRRASDPANTTPRLQGFDHVPVACGRHPGAAVRTDGRCGCCWSEANAVPDDAPPKPSVDIGHPLRDALRRVKCQ